MSGHSFAMSAMVAGWIALCAAHSVVAEDKILFDFAEPSSVHDWAPVKLPELKTDQPAPKIEIVSAGHTASAAPAPGKCLKITFEGGDWPAIATTKIPVEGNWKAYETLKADLTVDHSCVAYFRICQGKPDEKGNQPHWEKTMILLAGRNEVTLTIRHGLGVLDPGRGDLTSFVIGMFQPEKGQSLRVGNVRLSPDWPPPHVTDSFLAWYSPYNWAFANLRKDVQNATQTTESEVKMPGAITGALRAFGSRNARRSAAPRVKFTLDTVNHATRPTRGTAGWSSLRQDSPEHTFTRQHGKPL